MQVKQELSEKIYEEVKKLPKSLQREVLDFVQYLASKEEKEDVSEQMRQALRDFLVEVGLRKK